jgi:two-component system invasion response regulator UvrY
MPEKISILLVDDHNLVRKGFRRIIEDSPQMEVVGEAADGKEACISPRSFAHPSS